MYFKFITTNVTEISSVVECAAFVQLSWLNMQPMIPKANGFYYKGGKCRLAAVDTRRAPLESAQPLPKTADAAHILIQNQKKGEMTAEIFNIRAK